MTPQPVRDELTLGYCKNCDREYLTSQIEINGQGQELCPFCGEFDDREFYTCQLLAHIDSIYPHAPAECPERK